MVDVERSAESLARRACFAGEKDRLDLRIEEVLHRGSRARTEAVLHGDEANELARQGHKEDASSLRLELGDTSISCGYADPLAKKKRAAADHKSLAGRRQSRHP
jgi:hypothetical protein